MKLAHLSTRDLELQAKTVETQIKKLDHHRLLTPAEQVRVAELKRMRLSLKDRLAQV